MACVRIILTLIACVACSAICMAEKGDLKTIMPAEGKLIEDIVYKTSRQGNQCLDIYIPNINATGKLPVVVYIHGGSWMHGSKDEPTKSVWARAMLTDLLKNGYAVVSINYRLVNDSITVIYPEPLADCKDAVKWVKANAEKYKLDANRVAVMGSSAGAHLALMTAYSPDGIAMGDAVLRNYDSKVKCVVDIYGPTDLSNILQSRLPSAAISFASLLMKKSVFKMRSTLLWSFTGESAFHPIRRTRECLLYSPMTYVRDAVPTIVFHGTKDMIVPYKHTTRLENAMRKNNKEIEVHPVEGENHGFRTMNVKVAQEISAQLINFLKIHL